jgi:hypothetical protein
MTAQYWIYIFKQVLEVGMAPKRALNSYFAGSPYIPVQYKSQNLLPDYLIYAMAKRETR